VTARGRECVWASPGQEAGRGGGSGVRNSDAVWGGLGAGACIGLPPVCKCARCVPFEFPFAAVATALVCI